MPIDTEAKRRRVAGVPPLPSGDIDARDRAHIAGIYFIPGLVRSKEMPRARPLPFDTRKGPLSSEDRLLPIIPPVPVIYASMPSKKITIGDRLYPFAGLVFDGPSNIASARWRKDGDAFTSVSLGDFTDILSASRFVNEVINIYGIFFYEIELTDELGNVHLAIVDALSKITLGSGKSVGRNVNFRPFADSIIAEDPSQISSIKYKVDGDTTVAKTSITRHVLFSGTHDGASNNADLIDTGRDLTTLGIKIGDIAKNVTDGSEGVITAIVGDTITATLSGGTDNDWDVSDVYEILDGATLDIIARSLEISIATGGFNSITLYVNDLSSNES
ncbi:hypothetical protein LCGC14_3157030, partial [marine sediment metagenome]